MRRRVVSECAADDCSAASPRVYDISLSSLPKKIQEKIKQKQIKGKLRRCSYCGTIWAEDFDVRGMRTVKQKIGTRKLGSDEMIWFI
ncbi:MAG TPA: hypothetical protein VMW41_00450 [Candidatus Bathyarchaeia archaeon]|nr:hypothetical protein [Candidatus Bathyarchaeia archaeon]